MTPSEYAQAALDKMRRDNAQAPPRIPDNPPCDGCLKPFCGTMQCGKCESAFYCCRACQVSHWKSEHRGDCAALKILNEAKAQKVLEKFVEDQDWWNLLDKTATYKAAVRQGLHDKIREVLELDRDTLLDRYRAGHDELSHTHRVMHVIFRANRAEGNNPNGSDMDGRRIKAYVTSHPDALLAWFHASAQLLKALVDPDAAKSSNALSTLTTDADDVWMGWVAVFANPVASRAILLPLPTISTGASSTDGASTKEEKAEQKHQRQARVDHATKIVSIFADVISLARSRLELNKREVWFNFLLAAAAVHVRLLEYKVPVNTELKYKLRGKIRMFFHKVCVPVAKATIATGGPINKSDLTPAFESLILSHQPSG
jgi:MYND finger